VLIPTHDHHDTLDLAVASALGQTVDDLEVIVIGDGVTPEVRARARALEQADSRVRFMDMEKGPHHGEAYRDLAIHQAASDIVCYLCDDDLFLPEHVEDMLDLLRYADLANCLNGAIDASGHFIPYAADLGSESYRRWMCHPDRNGVSLTGTAHTVQAYRRLPVGWEVPPPGSFPDHYLWRKFLADPDLRAATSCRVTALQFPTHTDGRSAWSGAERRAELLRWASLPADAERREQFDHDVRGSLGRDLAFWHSLADERLDLSERLAADLDQVRVELADLRPRLEVVHDELARTHQQLDRAQSDHQRVDQLATTLRRQFETAQDERNAATDLVTRMEGTRTWRLRAMVLHHRVVRAIVGRIRRL
jgi:Glycosyl transferase family 2